MNTIIPYHEKINPESALKYASDLNFDIEIFHVNRENESQDLKKNIEAQTKKINGEKEINIAFKDGLIFNELKARIHDFELIIMVTRSEENIDKTLGSVTSHLVDSTKKDVLILPENFNYKPPQKALVIGEFNTFRHDIISPKMEMLQKNYPDLSVQGIHFTDESEEEQIVKIENTTTYSLNQFPGILFDKEIDFDQFDLIFLAFSGRGSMLNKTFPGNLARKLALKTGKGVWIIHE